MSSFVAANLAISAYNILWVLGMNVCMFLRVFPSDLGFKIIIGTWIVSGVALYTIVFKLA